MTETAASEINRFKRWVVANGGEALAGTNPYEVFRFASDRGVGVIYMNAAGRRTWTGAAADLLPVFRSGSSVRLMPKAKSKHSDKRYPALIERDGRFCWYGCGTEMTVDAATIEHLCSRTHGGPDHVANLVLSCAPCNATAGHLSVAEKVAIRDQRRPACNRTLARNLVALLYSLDKHEIEPMPDEAWARFRDDPCRTFLKMDDGAQERVWAGIEVRLTKEMRR